MSTDDIMATPAAPGTAMIPTIPDKDEASPHLHVVEQAEPTTDGRDRSRIDRLPIEALGDLELKVEVVLGRARLRLQEMLDVRPGQAIELDRARNSPVDVLVNGTLFARGEIVVIDETNLGVRVSEVLGSDPVKEAH